MRRCILALATPLAVLASPPPAAAERLVTTISRHQVMVTSNFTGTSIVLFGTVEPDTPAARRRTPNYDLVVTIAGPKQTTVTLRKERVLGIWTNVASRTFEDAPNYLAVLSNRPFEAITDQETRKRMQIGLENILLSQSIGGAPVEAPADDIFRSSFVRLKMSHGLYSQLANGVTLLTPTVFRAGITLPAEAPVGNYDVDIKVFADGTMLARASSAFEIIKVGFEQWVAAAARDYGLFYGIGTAMMAVFTGWFASVVFRRD